MAKEKWIKHPYSWIWSPVEATTRKRPTLEVQLLRGSEAMTQIAVVDSGADMNIASLEVAEFLGISGTHEQKITLYGITGDPAIGFISNVDMKIKGMSEVITIPIFFVDGLKTNMLLGQWNFFDCFKILFDKNHDTFEICRI